MEYNINDTVNNLYKQLCECQELNPEEEEGMGEDSDIEEGAGYEEYDEGAHGGTTWYTQDNVSKNG